MIKFSILIPNYGYGEHLRKCLESLRCFNYLKKEIEIILCDQSEISVFTMVKKLFDEMFFANGKIIHYNEIGLLKNRHRLMEEARGEYVIFLDSDDFLIENSIYLLSKQLEKYNYPDILVHPLIICDENHHKISCRLYSKENIENFRDYFYFDDIFNSICAKTFKRKLYHKDCAFNINARLGEDKIFSIPIVENAKNIIISNSLSFYCYVANPYSMTKRISFKDAIDNLYLLPKKYFNNMTEKQKIIFTENKLSVFKSNFLLLNKKDEKKYIISFRHYLDELTLLNKKNVVKIKNKLFLLLLKYKFYAPIFLFKSFKIGISYEKK